MSLDLNRRRTLKLLGVTINVVVPGGDTPHEWDALDDDSVVDTQVPTRFFGDGAILPIPEEK